MSWRSCRQREQPHSAERDRTVGPPLLSHSLHGAHKKSQSGKHKPLNLRHEPEPGLFLHLCSTESTSAGKRSWFSAGTKSSKYGSHFETRARGPRKGKWILAVHKDCAVNQAALSGLSQDVCPDSARWPQSYLLLQDFRDAERSTATSASWLETATAKQHLTNERCCPGTASAVIRKLLLRSETSSAGIWVTSLARLRRLFHHWAEK